MKPICLFVIIVTCISLSCRSENKWKLVWSDEFEYTGLPDATKWSYDTLGNEWGWGNNEAQFYTAGKLKNAYVSDGTLKIVALIDSAGGKRYTSARLVTRGKGDWLYGKFEIRAKLPAGKGTWPSICRSPTDSYYGDWPDSGEIDIMENVGFDPDNILATVHTKKYNHVLGTQTSGKMYVPTAYTGFHVYGLEWDENKLRAYIDGEHYYTHKNERNGPDTWPFDRRFHLILNLAIGGNWGGAMGIDENSFPKILEIDYVRVFHKSLN